MKKNLWVYEETINCTKDEIMKRPSVQGFPVTMLSAYIKLTFIYAQLQGKN